MKKSVMKIGIVGFSRNRFDKIKARIILEEVLKELQTKHPDKGIEQVIKIV